MATQTLSTFDALFKNLYRGPLVELLNQETYMLDKVEQKAADDIGTLAGYGGRQLIFPVHTSRNRGRGAVSDGGTLPVAGKQAALDATVTIQQFSTGIELTDLVIRQSAKDEGAFVRALEFEMDGAMTDLKKDMNRMVYGTGDGLLATVTGTPGAGTSITVDSGQYIAVGDTVDIIVKSSGATTNGVVGTVVTAVSYTGTAGSSTQANATITISSPTVGATSNLYGVYISGDRSGETAGLRNITNTGRVLFNIDSSANPIWDGNVTDAANSNPTEDLLMQLVQRIRQRAGKRIDSIVTTYGVQRRLANQYASQKRWNDDHATTVDGGYSAIMIASGDSSIPVVADVDCPNGFAFALNLGSFAWAEIDRPDWLSPPEGGGGILQLKDGATAGTKVASWQAWILWDSTLVNVAPPRNGQVKNLNDDVPITRV